MSKMYKGWELIKAIADGEIKSGVHIRVYTNSYNVDYWFWGNWFGRKDYSEPLDNIELYLCSKDCIFELIEEEIDIDNIEDLLKIEEYEVDKTDTVINRNKINELIQAVKQLDRKIREEK